VLLYNPELVYHIIASMSFSMYEANIDAFARKNWNCNSPHLLMPWIPVGSWSVGVRFHHNCCCLCFAVMQVRCWEVQQSGTVIPKAQQTHTGPVLDVSWSDVSSVTPAVLFRFTSVEFDFSNVWHPTRHIIGHFGDESSQAINYGTLVLITKR